MPLRLPRDLVGGFVGKAGASQSIPAPWVALIHLLISSQVRVLTQQVLGEGVTGMSTEVCMDVYPCPRHQGQNEGLGDLPDGGVCHDARKILKGLGLAIEM